MREIDKKYPRHRNFLRHFTDAFGAERRPTVLIIKPDASPHFTTADALVSFRDVLSVSTVPRSRARSIEYDRSRGIYYSKAFEFYPWVLGRDYKDLIAVTPSMVALHSVRKFRGQVAPEISDTKFSLTDLDQTLFDELINRWRRSYRRGKPTWKDVALMRSLNMAHHASQLPAPVAATVLDYGRLAALWVSAFEHLVNPGSDGGGIADRKKVCELLEKTTWTMKENRNRNLKCWRNKKKTIFERRPLPSWLCFKLYDVRNDFLHGNPIEKRPLHLPGTKFNLLDFAAPLYRMALTSFLDLQWKGELPPMDDAQAFAQAFQERHEFDHYQRDFEVALAMSRGYEPAHVAVRRERRRRRT